LGDVAAFDASGRRRGVPRHERARAQKSLMAGAKPMSSNGEQVANNVVYNLFSRGRHLLRAPHQRLLRARAFARWDAVTAA
jgi:hypothetical protein